MKKKRLFSLLILSLSLTSCSDISGSWITIIPNKQIITYVNTSVDPFNTVMSLRYFSNDDNPLEQSKIDEITDLYTNEVNRLHKMFDRHYYYYQDETKTNYLTNLRTVNVSYGKNQEITVQEELYNLLKKGVELFELTDGYFNIFTGLLTDYWDDAFKKINDFEDLEDVDPYFSTSESQRLENIVQSIPKDIETIRQMIIFDDDNKTVTFNKLSDDNVALSVGGIAKGYATDIIKNTLLNNNYKDGYLYSGGSSITTLSKPIYSKKSKGHTISVANPLTSKFYDSKIAFSLCFENEFSFSTSGNSTSGKSYHFEDNGNVIYRHHIYNPYTGYPENYYHSVSISSNTIDNITLDALSTAIMNLDVDDAFKLVNKVSQKYPESDLGIYLLSTQTDEKGNLKMYTNSKNKTLKAKEGVTIYEK